MGEMLFVAFIPSLLCNNVEGITILIFSIFPDESVAQCFINNAIGAPSLKRPRGNRTSIIEVMHQQRCDSVNQHKINLYI